MSVLKEGLWRPDEHLTPAGSRLDREVLVADTSASWESILALQLGNAPEIVRARLGLETLLSANAGPFGDVFDVLPRSSGAEHGQLLVHAVHLDEHRAVKLAQALSGFLRELLGEVAIGVGTMRLGEHSPLRLTKMADLALFVALEQGPPVVQFNRGLLDRFGPGPGGSLAHLRPGDPPRSPGSPLDRRVTPEVGDPSDAPP